MLPENTSRRGFLKGFAAMAAGIAALTATRSLPDAISNQATPPATPTPPPAPKALKPGHYKGEVDVSEYVTKHTVDQYAFERFPRGPHMGEELVRDQLECMGYGPRLEYLDDLRFAHGIDLRDPT